MPGMLLVALLVPGVLVPGFLIPRACGQSTAAVPSLQDSTEQKLADTLRALEQGLAFMEENHEYINLDGLIGTRLVEGQLEVLLQHLQAASNPRVSVAAERKLEALRSKASAVSEAAMPFVIASQPDYYARIGPIIQEGFWSQEHASRDVEPGLVTKPTVQGEAMHERDSDDCLTELFGTSGAPNGQPCHVSRYCWKLMSAPGYRGYSLSHQLFYMLIAEASGCIPSDVQASVDDLSSGFCANMMVQAQTIAREHFPLHNQDLFMEIQALCGVAGFSEFFHDDWLDTILSWQWQPQGCWGKHQVEDPESTSRSKREERVLADGCLSHRTAVALGALVQNVRYIVEFLQRIPPAKQF